MPKIVNTEKVNKSLFKIYLEKAEEFYKLMRMGYSQSLWNGVGLNAVHCTISSCDALTTFYLGERSRNQKHADVIILLERLPLEDLREKTQQLTSILAIKNLVEYEAREFRQDDAQKILSQSERFYKWVKTNLPQ